MFLSPVASAGWVLANAHAVQDTPHRPAHTQTHTTDVKTPFDRLFKEAFMIFMFTQKPAFPPYEPSPGNRNLSRCFATTAALV